MRAAIAYNQLLSRVTRTGPWSEQAISTHRLVEVAVADGRESEAAELARYTLIEMAEVADLFPGFFESARRYLIREGVSLELLSEAEQDDVDLIASWEEYERAVSAFAAGCEAGQGTEAIGPFKAALSRWRTAHDLGCNLVYAYADVCAKHLGEDRVVDFWDELMSDFYPTRDRFDLDRSPWNESFEILALDTAETFRGHLSGPGRLGDIEITDEPDRIVFSFSPCGTGGRTFLEERDAGAGSEMPMDGPRRFAVTTQPHDWSWGKTGVCLYCVHCCQLQERIPIRRFGYPLRVVEPPLWPQARDEGRCTWTIFKNPANVPAEAYARVGEQKPARLGSNERAELRT